ncbi:hypothetical protein [Actinomadura rupiterrae]|uniref:hypothetical protein n=1 Tax=Actinomadura rupiterrae TaxID=559627 RepID=UPI0020A427A0|nr:hypothetical protein [Actinomadura rupiterrae]MCP2340157.1 hypothetical protein [Actinomadura rupiterrae]
MSAWRNGAVPCPLSSATYAGATAASVHTGNLGGVGKLGGGKRMDARFQAEPAGFGLSGEALRLRGLMQQVSRDEHGGSVLPATGLIATESGVATDKAEDEQPIAPATTHVNVPSPRGDESGPYPWRRRPV